jgi:cell pole-organizing protein PopZ
MQQPGEPSVEEILESIKKVIARETGPVTPAPPRRPPAATPEPIEPAAPQEAEEVLELDEDAMLALTEHEIDASERYEAAQAEGHDADAPLTGDATASAMRENFAALAMLAQPGRQPQIVRSGETSLEGMVREMLRPMLAQWLDDNLPAMVEELVKAEIARIAGKRS